MNHPPRQDHTEWKELHTRTIVNGIPTEDIHLTSELKNGVTELSGTVNGKKVFITRPHQPISQLLFPKKSVRFMEDEASFPSEILPIERTPTPFQPIIYYDTNNTKTSEKKSRKRRRKSRRSRRETRRKSSRSRRETKRNRKPNPK